MKINLKQYKDNDTFYDVDCFYQLYNAIPNKHNDVVEFLLKTITHPKWREDLGVYLKTKEQDIFIRNLLLILVNANKSETVDLFGFSLFLKEKKEEPYFAKDSYLEESIDQEVTDEILNKFIENFKQEFPFKDIYFSKTLTNKTLVKYLLDVKLAIESFRINFEINESVEDPLRLHNYILAIDLFEEGCVEGVVFAPRNGRVGEETVYMIFKDRLFEDENKNKFLNIFVDHCLKPTEQEQKNMYIQTFSEYLYDIKEVLFKNKREATTEFEFIDSLLESLNYFLDQKEAYSLNETICIHYYLKWKEDFIKLLDDYNVNRMLKNNLSLKKEIFNLGIIFKYVLLNKYHFSFWKDLLILDLMTENLKVYDVSYQEFEDVVFKIIENQQVYGSFIKEFKKDLIERFLHSSYLGFIDYYSENSFVESLTKPILVSEKRIEKDFWEANLDLF